MKRLLPYIAALAMCVGTVVVAFAQSWQSGDPCAVYPHQTVAIPNATPTSKLIAGVLGKQIYICAIHVQQVAGSTPGLTLTYGEVVAATPCATATPGATIGVFGSVAAGSNVNVGNGSYSVGIAPAAAATPVIDVCSLTTSAAFVSGSVEFVQR